MLLIGLVSPAAQAQSSTPIDCSPIIGKPLQPIPEITRTGTFVRGTLVTAGTLELIAEIPKGAGRSAGSLLKSDGTVDNTKIRCLQQWFRTYSKDAPRGSQDPLHATVINPLPVELGFVCVP